MDVIVAHCNFLKIGCIWLMRLFVLIPDIWKVFFFLRGWINPFHFLSRWQPIGSAFLIKEIKFLLIADLHLKYLLTIEGVSAKNGHFYKCLVSFFKENKSILFISCPVKNQLVAFWSMRWFLVDGLWENLYCK